MLFFIYIDDIFSSAHFFWRKNLPKVQQSLGPDIASSHTEHITPSPWYSCSSFIINGWSMWASWGAWLPTLNKHSIKSSAYFAGHKLKRCSFHMTNYVQFPLKQGILSNLKTILTYAILTSSVYTQSCVHFTLKKVLSKKKNLSI
jgi:hypothetical protein